VELHGGSIAALSDGADRGSEFVVRLPIVLAATPTADPLALPERPPTPLAAGRVLVVDDNRDAMESMTRLLTLMGCEVRGACDGIAALELAAEFQPHIIFLDIGMPAMNGYDVCRAVREQPWGRTAVMVAVTGWGQEDDRRKSKDAGFDDHLVKPVDVRSLRQILAGDAAAYDRTERGSPLSSLAATAPRSGG
jgi:CheY-like chemotaxis protein